MFQSSKFGDNNGVLEIFMPFEDLIKLERYYFCEASINYYIRSKQFQSGNMIFTDTKDQNRKTKYNFVNYDNQRAFYELDDIKINQCIFKYQFNNIIIQNNGHNTNNKTKVLFSIYSSSLNKESRTQLNMDNFTISQSDGVITIIRNYTVKNIIGGIIQLSDISLTSFAILDRIAMIFDHTYHFVLILIIMLENTNLVNNYDIQDNTSLIYESTAMVSINIKENDATSKYTNGYLQKNAAITFHNSYFYDNSYKSGFYSGFNVNIDCDNGNNGRVCLKLYYYNHYDNIDHNGADYDIIGK